MTRAHEETRHHSGKDGKPPRAVVKKMHWPFPLVWLVPIGALILTGYFLRNEFEIRGPEITIQFTDGNGLKPGQTGVVIHGVKVGEVSAVDLADDEKQVIVHVHLERKYAGVAKKGTQFWVVRPEVSIQAISGLGAILSGPYIEALPGGGDSASDFVGMDSAPPLPGRGMHFVLVTDRVEKVQPESPVTYRGIQVGAVQNIGLSDDSQHAMVHIFIEQRYTPLVTSNSQFWVVSGADIHGGIITGVKVKIGSLSSILTGQVAFATPEKDAGPVAKEGSMFMLHEDADKEWLDWQPSIHVSQDTDLDANNVSKEEDRDLPEVKH
jgi:paraquat-inducible protein B